jgi:hypothetical protein
VGDLAVGDRIQSHDGDILTLTKRRAAKALHDTFNFEVADFHTYFVGEDGAWVHNMKDCGELPGGPALKGSTHHPDVVESRSRKWHQKYGDDGFENAARHFGYERTKSYPFNSHGQRVYFNGKNYITPDVDSHVGGVWKMFDRHGRRMGTYNGDLQKIAK